MFPYVGEDGMDSFRLFFFAPLIWENQIFFRLHVHIHEYEFTINSGVFH